MSTKTWFDRFLPECDTVTLGEYRRNSLIAPLAPAAREWRRCEACGRRYRPKTYHQRFCRYACCRWFHAGRGSTARKRSA